MMRRLVLVVIVVFLLVATAGSALATPPGAPFAGRWEGVDPVTGSHLRLRISPSLKVTLFNDGDPRCGPIGGPYYHSVSTGKEFPLGVERITGTLTVHCLGGSTRPEDWPYTLTYHPGSDTLTSLFVEYHRA
jgi:hypothetical protein